jgi:hypothetical protein
MSNPSSVRRAFGRMAFVFTALLSVVAPATAASAPGLELRAGDRVVLIGDALIEREQQAGWIELMLTSRFPDRDITFRNLGWGGDTRRAIPASA